MVLGKEGMSPLRCAFFRLRSHNPDLIRKACRRMASILPKIVNSALWHWHRQVGKSKAIIAPPAPAMPANIPRVVDGTMKIKSIMDKRPRTALRNLKKNKHIGDLLMKACKLLMFINRAEM